MFARMTATKTQMRQKEADGSKCRRQSVRQMEIPWNGQNDASVTQLPAIKTGVGKVNWEPTSERTDKGLSLLRALRCLQRTAVGAEVSWTRSCLVPGDSALGWVQHGTATGLHHSAFAGTEYGGHLLGHGSGGSHPWHTVMQLGIRDRLAA